ncbi:ABC transporter substrate-binding protein [Lactococcus hodotermopsidis]|uniref:ABC transporter substrate-binding protein n=1 Tax=Pseudolactococcus hodotermopsidis TaxID=2709157 RepID=A0A6A0B9Y7_9LACT|nr:extracellular solute-binding protein [Lactococcus hodotermopsidis]GFH41525.1 ABC transporter substrate-binding protein [Lactococcus hodotermopsidis]
MLKRKKLLIGAAVAALGVSALLTGCGGKKADDASGDKDGKVKISMAWWGSQVRHDATVKVIEMYEKENPKVDIEYEFYDMDGYLTKLNTLAASKTVWDVFQMGGNFPAFIDSIEPLDQYIKDGLIDTSNISEGYLATTQQDGKQWGISNGVGAYGIAYDPAMFKKAGLDEPTPDWTWADFEEMCLKIHDKTGQFGFSNFDDFKTATMAITQTGGGNNFFSTETNSKTMGFKDPKLLVPYLEMRKNLVDAGAYPDPGAIKEIKDIEGDYLVTGEAAMTWVAANQLQALRTAAGREIKMMTLPKTKADVPGGGMMSSQMLSMAKNSKHKEEAAKFISYFETNIEANKILNGERGVPIDDKVREELTKTADENMQEVYNYIDLVGEFDKGEGNPIESPANAAIEDQYKLLLEQVLYDQTTPAKAAKDLYAFAKEQLGEK